jgi:hypothetical protein
MKPEIIARSLTFAGAIPFVVGAMGVTHLIPDGWFGIQPEALLASYGAVILSFLAGSHWGLHVASPDRFDARLLLSSNVIAVSAWLALLLFPGNFPLTLSVLIAGFVVQLWIDRALWRSSRLASWYFRMRVKVTVVVIACLSIPLLNLLTYL